MKGNFDMDKRWDAYTIATIMRGFLRTVFTDVFPDHIRAKDFLGGILQVVKARNDRSHHLQFNESHVVGSLHQMVRVLKSTGHHDAADKISLILKKANEMLAECPDEGGRNY